ncbi:Ribosomal protein S4/S9 protein [Raphanus sativus]|nr:Ribosomal protein S4/S9 protein [Raphanus sativus]
MGGRDDYKKYSGLSRMVQNLTNVMKQMDLTDPFRFQMTDLLLEKLYNMGVIPTRKSLALTDKLSVSSLCRRRLSTVLVHLKYAEHLTEAVTYIEQGAKDTFYISLFRRGETRSLPSSLQATTTVSITSYDNFMSNTFHSTPRPLPYDSDSGNYLRPRRDSLVSRRDKGSSHSQEEAEPLRSDTDDEDSESFSMERRKWADKLIISGDNSKEDFSKSSRRVPKPKDNGCW